MVDATIFIAIAIGCVVVLLLITVLFIYCLKRQHDKRERESQERREREVERYRRRAMRGRMVRPPDYGAHTRDATHLGVPIPFTPPPEYKELATPLPRNRTNEERIGIGGMPLGVAGTENIVTISRNVPPINTEASPQLVHRSQNGTINPRTYNRNDLPPSYSSIGNHPTNDNNRLSNTTSRHVSNIQLVNERNSSRNGESVNNVNTNNRNANILRNSAASESNSGGNVSIQGSRQNYVSPTRRHFHDQSNRGVLPSSGMNEDLSLI